MQLEASIANYVRFRRYYNEWHLINTDDPKFYEMRVPFPLLMQHDRSRRVGEAISWRHANCVVYATFRFFDAKLYDEVRRGLRPNLSIKIIPLVVERNRTLQTTFHRRWRVEEVSIVSVPANPTVGWGKSGLVPLGSSATIIPGAEWRDMARHRSPNDFQSGRTLKT